MNTRQPVIEILVSCRNILLGGRSNENVLNCLEGLLTDLDSIAVEGTKRIIEYCTLKAIDQIESADFVGAGMILNLIHNLPLSEVDRLSWDVDYFLSMELPTFLENFYEIKSARNIVLYICRQLAFQYIPSE